MNCQQVYLSSMWGCNNFNKLKSVPPAWWQTGSSRRSINMPISSGRQAARKRSTMEERETVFALLWNLLPTLVRIRPYSILQEHKIHIKRRNNRRAVISLICTANPNTHLISMGISWGLCDVSTTAPSSEMLKWTISSLKCLSSKSLSRFSL